MNTYGNSAFPMNSYLPIGADIDERNPANIADVIEVYTCANCDEEITDGKHCAKCAAVEAGMCCECFKEPTMKDSDICAGCEMDMIMYKHEQH